MSSPNLVHDAESLIRSLDGVIRVRILSGESGIDSVHVTARDDEAARFMAAHIRSALLAGLATPITAGRIHVSVDNDDPAHTPRPESSSGGSEGEIVPRGRIRLLEQQEQDSATSADSENGRADSLVPTDTAAVQEGLDGAGTERIEATYGEGRQTPRLPTHESPSPFHHPRLVAVDVNRPGDGRVLCKVAIAHASAVYRSEAVAVDLPGAAAQAAAQATVRALIDAGITGLQLNGMREVEIAGNEYVVVALRREDSCRRHRSGSAPVVGSPERSAAQATVAAAIEML